MDVIVNNAAQAGADTARPSREEAEAAVRTLIAWAGDDPAREGLVDTPQRVLAAYDDFFAGYDDDPAAVLARAFEDAGDYNDLVVLRAVAFTSHCAHHMMPIVGHAHIAYLPAGRVVGLSKLARVADLFARRLQSQENLTVQIADAIERVLRPRGVAVMIEAEHQCMSLRGALKHEARTVTSAFRGALQDDPALSQRFLAHIRGPALP